MMEAMYGEKIFSENKQFCVQWHDGHGDQNGKWIKGIVALFKGDELLYKKSISRPDRCRVGNEGLVVCNDHVGFDEKLSSKFLVIAPDGSISLSKTLSAITGDILLLSENSKIAVFETHYSDSRSGNKIFVVNLESFDVQSEKKPDFRYTVKIEEFQRRVRIEINDEIIIKPK